MRAIYEVKVYNELGVCNAYATVHVIMINLLFVCTVVGFLNTTFSGVEQGPGHSVPVGYRKGSGTNLVFNVGSTPGTASESNSCMHCSSVINFELICYQL